MQSWGSNAFGAKECVEHDVREKKYGAPNTLALGKVFVRRQRLFSRRQLRTVMCAARLTFNRLSILGLQRIL